MGIVLAAPARNGEYKLLDQEPLEPLRETLEAVSGPSPLTLVARVWAFQLPL